MSEMEALRKDVAVREAGEVGGREGRGEENSPRRKRRGRRRRESVTGIYQGEQTTIFCKPAYVVTCRPSWPQYSKQPFKGQVQG